MNKGNLKSVCCLLLSFLMFFTMATTINSFASTTNAKPNIIPALKEWTGATGKFVLTTDSKICVDANYESELLSRMTIFKDEIKLINSQLDLTTSTDPSNSGDIYITLDCNDTSIGNEGYILEIGDKVVVKANDANGAFFATRTLLQMLVTSYNNDSFPKGEIKDFPDYKSRAFMLDASRKYFTIEFVRDYVKLMSWFKMNDFHLHLSDDWYDGYWAFRIESNVPNLTATDGSYTKQEIIELQDLADEYGVTITPEFDAPAHARPFTKARPDLIYQPKGDRYLDLDNPDTYTFMKSIYDEFIPLFRGADFHIGCDEYDGGGEKYRQFYNTMADYVQSKGKNVRAWTGFQNASGTTEPESDIIIDVWEDGFDVNTYVNKGHKIINSAGHKLYIVPTSSYWKVDVPDLYENWEPHIFTNSNQLTPNHPNLLGAKLHIWLDGNRNKVNELYCDKLIQPALKVLSEKVWGNTDSNNYNAFKVRTEQIGNAPGTNLYNPAPTPPVNTDNLAYQKTVVATSVEPNTQFTADKAVDGSTTTRWASGYDDNSSIYVDLGEQKDIKKIILKWETAYGKKYKIQVSDDANTWTDVYEETNGDGGTDTINTTTQGRYVKMQGVQRATSWGYSIWEFEVYE